MLAGLASAVIGLGLLRRVDSAFGAVGASLFLVIAFVILNSCAILLLAGRTGSSPQPAAAGRGDVVLRRDTGPHALGQATLTLLGLWFAALGLVGGLTQNWLWPVLAVVPAVYFLGFPVLAATGRFRPGGVTVTDSSVVDEHFGVRSELPLTEVLDLSQRSEELVLVPRDARAVSRRHLTPRPWRARDQGDRLAVATRDLPGGSAGLGELLRSRMR